MKWKPVGVLLCLFAVQLASCSDGETEDCPSGEKRCDGECVSTADPSYGCAEPGCVPCGIANATSACSAIGQCVIAACKAGYRDCNGIPTDGCEVNVQDDVMNCGECRVDCSEHDWPHVTDYTCRDAQCFPLACESGWEDADESPENGCETEL